MESYPFQKDDEVLSTLALANRSAALCRMGRWSEASADLDQAIQANLHPAPEKLYQRRIKCLEQRGNRADATELLQKAKELFS